MAPGPAKQFVVGPDEKVLVVAGRKKDFQPWLDQNPHMKGRVLISDNDDKRDTVSVGVKGILFGRYVNHADKNRLTELARKNGVNFTRFFPSSGELKAFLEMSVIKTSTNQNSNPNPSADPTQDVKDPAVNPTDEEKGENAVPTKQPKGAVKEFVFSNANFQAAKIVEESKRLYDLAVSQGLHTTQKSIEMALYTIRKECAGAVSGKPVVAKKAGKARKDGPAEALTTYIDSMQKFMGSSEIVVVAMQELLEKNSQFEAEKAEWAREKAKLQKEKDDLKREIARLQGGFKKKLAEFLKQM